MLERERAVQGAVLKTQGAVLKTQLIKIMLHF